MYGGSTPILNDLSFEVTLMTSVHTGRQSQSPLYLQRNLENIVFFPQENRSKFDFSLLQVLKGNPTLFCIRECPKLVCSRLKRTEKIECTV